MDAVKTIELSAPGRFVSPLVELGAYEWLWTQPRASFKTIADRFRANPNARPSDFAPKAEAQRVGQWVVSHFREHGVERFGVRIHRAGEYPNKLRDARHPIELLTYSGTWELVEAPGVAVVGARKVSDDGRRRTRKLTQSLVKDGFTIISGLAEGVDTEAHTTALRLGAPTIAVLGTPLSEVYPQENRQLQKEISENHLVLSQVPALRYSQQGPRVNRFFFPERNVTMSALSVATVIVEASETSGTLTQARAALHQKRKVFILDSCFRNSSLSWPAKFEKKGAIRISDYDELRVHLGKHDANLTGTLPN